jgi:hypothetical protein
MAFLSPHLTLMFLVSLFGIFAIADGRCRCGLQDFSFGSLESDLAHCRAFRAAGVVGGA